MWCDLIGSYWILFLNFSNLFVVGTPMPFILTCPCSFSLPFSVGIQGMVVGPCLFVKTSGHDVFVPEAWNMASFGVNRKPFRCQKWQLSTLETWKMGFSMEQKVVNYCNPLKKRSATSRGEGCWLALGVTLDSNYLLCFFPLFWNFGNPIW